MELNHILEQPIIQSRTGPVTPLPSIVSILAAPGGLVAQLAYSRGQIDMGLKPLTGVMYPVPLMSPNPSNPSNASPDIAWPNTLKPSAPGQWSAPSPPIASGPQTPPEMAVSLPVREEASANPKIPVVGTITVSQLKVDSATCMFCCPTCGRKFKRKSDLVRHERIHTGERPNSCFVCNKRFIQRSALRVHLRVHTGEKPYSCATCQRQFSDSSSLARHRKMHLRDNTRVILSQFMQTPCLPRRQLYNTPTRSAF